MDNTLEQYTKVKANFHAWLHQQKEETDRHLYSAQRWAEKLQAEFDEPNFSFTPRSLSQCRVASLPEKANLLIWRLGLLNMAQAHWRERYNAIEKAIEGNGEILAKLYDEFRCVDKAHSSVHAAMLQEMISGWHKDPYDSLREEDEVYDELIAELEAA